MSGNWVTTDTETIWYLLFLHLALLEQAIRKMFIYQ